MDIGLYIGELLRGQDEVNVAGLGTFIKIRTAGSFDSSNNKFYPPAFQISFKESQINDSSLIQIISSEKNLSKSSVEELIKKFSAGILELLNSSDSVEIRPLGFLHKANGKLTLNSADDFGVINIFYGLKPIAEIKTEVFLPEQEEITETQESEEIEEEFEEIKKTRSWISIFISFLAFLIAVTALFYFNSDFNNFIKTKSAGIFSSTNKVEQAAPDLIDSTKISSDSIKNAVDSASIVSDSLKQKTDTAITVAKESVPIDLPSESEVISYEIIAAAFSRKSEADVYISELSKKGIQGKIVENMPGKMLKISLGTFFDEESAKKELNRIQKNINKDAWIARVKQSKNPK